MVADTGYALTGIHLPENRDVTHRLRKLSYVPSWVVMLVELVVIVGWVLDLPGLKSFPVGYSDTPLLMAVLFMVAAGSLFFHAREKYKDITLVVFAIIPTVSGGLVLVGGFLNLVGMLGESNLSVSLGLALIGLALGLSHIKAVAHRFHIVQSLAFVVLTFNAIVILGFFYRALSGSGATWVIGMPVNIALVLFLLSLSIMLRWSGRGYMGIFAADTVSSMYALRLLVVRMVIAPMVGVVGLIAAQVGAYSIYDAVAFIVVMLIVMAAVLAWFNIKLLYRLELERFAMKEELRIHNIHLKLSNEDMAIKMDELEKAKQKYASHLNYQDKFMDIAETLG